MPAPDSVMDLISHFRENLDTFKTGGYNETQVRREFIDPLFEALGWDIANKSMYSAAYKDVVHEDAIKVAGSTKAPDYAFRVGGVRKFFLEAKKPAVNIKEDATAAYQLRRYAWSAKLPISILTDFEEFAVYDCRIRPKPTDRASVGRIRYLTFEEYPKVWDELVSTFSRQAIYKGAFDKYVQETKQKRGTTEVDDAFLDEIEQWREILAHNIALRNAGLTTRDLNTAVQRTIDRIVFLRIAEDRGIEPYGRLRDLSTGSHSYQRLVTFFRQADGRYNSGLFHFRKEDGVAESLDTFTLALAIDDKVLQPILKRLYYPESPYEFSVLSGEILGQVYEQFLGKIITLKGRKVDVEEKPEIKKAGGIYYTPDYVVRYIVTRTLPPLIEGKTPNELSGSLKRNAAFRVLDPACGSGSFLIQAYQLLLDWHRDAYLKDDPTKYAKGGAPRFYQDVKGEWRLTIAEKRRILLTHIFGVDIDPQAVEVTKLSLLLKVLEGESGDQIARQMDLFHMRALPDLSRNIKCGNSLIGPDFFQSRPLELTVPETVDRINAFDWYDAFKTVIDEGGFSAVIGNPPYRKERDFKHLMNEIAATKFGSKFASPRMDLWYYFVHRGLELLSPTGRLGFIVNSYWTAGTGAEKLITEISSDGILDEIFYLGSLKVFDKVSGSHMILSLDKAKTRDTITIKHCAASESGSAEPFLTGIGTVLTVEKTPEETFRNGKIDISLLSHSFLDKLEQCPTLNRIAIIRQGIAENPSTINKKTAARFKGKYEVGAGVFVLSDGEKKALKLSAEEKTLVRSYHDLRDIDRYYVDPNPAQSIIYSTKTTIPDIRKYPHLMAHLTQFKAIMAKRRETHNGANKWWHLHWPREENIWKTTKIVVPNMAARPSFALAIGDCYTTFSTNVVLLKSDDLQLQQRVLGILNSRAVWAWLQHHAKRRGVGLELNGNVLVRIPIPKGIGATTPKNERLSSLVGARIEASSNLRNAKADGARNTISRQIDELEKQIDELVYDMFGFTPEDIQAVQAETTLPARGASRASTGAAAA